MLNWLRNKFSSKYASHPEAVIIACYFNPKNSKARLNAFNQWYATIKHLNHRIIECVQEGVGQQLPNSPHITRISAKNTLWYKEQLLNKVIQSLPERFKYVLWVDADVIFSNRYWMVEAVQQLQTNNVVQLFEYAIHMEKGQSVPHFNVENERKYILSCDAKEVKIHNRRMWKSYASNFVERSERPLRYMSDHYDVRGHVGFAWGARREVLKAVPLYDRALIGGGDGIIAYASTGQLVGLRTIKEMFGDILDDVYAWGKQWHDVVQGKVGCVKGDLYHIWHGDIKDRQYYKRTREFGQHLKRIHAESQQDENGLYVAKDPKARQYVSSYYKEREPDNDDDFATGLAIGLMEESDLVSEVMGLASEAVGDIMESSREAVAVPTTQPTTQPSSDGTLGYDIPVERPMSATGYDSSDNNQNAS